MLFALLKNIFWNRICNSDLSGGKASPRPPVIVGCGGINDKERVKNKFDS